jgi:hypothetical protein
MEVICSKYINLPMMASVSSFLALILHLWTVGKKGQRNYSFLNRTAVVSAASRCVLKLNEIPCQIVWVDDGWGIVWKTGADGGISVWHKEIGWQGVECCNLYLDRDQLWVIVNMVMHFQAPYNVGKYLDQLKKWLALRSWS